MKKHSLAIVALIVVALVVLASGVALAGGGRGNSTGTCKGAGTCTGDAAQLQLRDGTGENCPGPEACLGVGDQTQAGIQARTRSCNGDCASNTTESQTESRGTD